MRESHVQGVRVSVSEKKERRDSERKGRECLLVVLRFKVFKSTSYSY